MNYKDFLDSAESMKKNGALEVDYRNSVSRAYYSALHACSELAKHFDLVHSTTGSGTHLELARVLRDCNKGDLDTRQRNRIQEVGKIFKKLIIKRKHADYILYLPCGERDARETLRHSRKILAVVSQLCNTETPSGNGKTPQTIIL